MFDLIVLGVVLAGLMAIVRAPVPGHRPEKRGRPAPTLWSPRTGWRRFDKPTYLRRGLVPGGGTAGPNPAGERPSPDRAAAPPNVPGETR
jgi:hypothetical protein